MSAGEDIPTPAGPSRRRVPGPRALAAGALGSGLLALGILVWGGPGAAAASSVDRGVVDITTTLADQDGAAAGTGMVLSSSGLVLTNNHVVKGADNIRVRVVATGRTYRATVLGTDAVDDVALLKLSGASGLATVSLGSSAELSVGDAVRAVGNAGGEGGEPTVAAGRVTGLGRAITVSDEPGQGSARLTGLIRVDARLQPGESGGPMLDASGRVIGMNTAAAFSMRFASSASEGYAIPIDKALGIASQIRAGRSSARVHIGSAARLGVQVAGQGDPSGDGVRGALVMGVAGGSPAESAGLEAGDVITSLGGRAVTSSDSLSTAMFAHHPGDRVTVRWTHQSGQTGSATVALAVGPPA